MKPAPIWLGIFAIQLALVSTVTAEDEYPRYKPSSGSPLALDIRSNSYGASRDAPHALGIGAVVPDFEVPKVGGGSVSLDKLREQGSVVIVFYRGHW